MSFEAQRVSRAPAPLQCEAGTTFPFEIQRGWRPRRPSALPSRGSKRERQDLETHLAVKAGIEL